MTGIRLILFAMMMSASGINDALSASLDRTTVLEPFSQAYMNEWGSYEVYYHIPAQTISPRSNTRVYLPYFGSGSGVAGTAPNGAVCTSNAAYTGGGAPIVVETYSNVYQGYYLYLRNITKSDNTIANDLYINCRVSYGYVVSPTKLLSGRCADGVKMHITARERGTTLYEGDYVCNGSSDVLYEYTAKFNTVDTSARSTIAYSSSINMKYDGRTGKLPLVKNVSGSGVSVTANVNTDTWGTYSPRVVREDGLLCSSLDAGETCYLDLSTPPSGSYTSGTINLFVQLK